MSKINLPITSREYKLMLNVARFENLDRGVSGFLRLIEFHLQAAGGVIVKKQKEETTRRTSYLDVIGSALRQRGLILRLREEQEKFIVTLKYRDEDRYLAAAQDVASTATGKPKFEEDILPPFASKYSKSTSVEIEGQPHLGEIGGIRDLFPGLAVLQLPDDIPVSIVGGFKAFELSRKLCKFTFDGELEVKAALSFWYLLGEEDEMPIVGEFSFDYDSPGNVDGVEQFPRSTVEGANRLFTTLQGQRTWFDLSLTTKTAFALDTL